MHKANVSCRVADGPMPGTWKGAAYCGHYQAETTAEPTAMHQKGAITYWGPVSLTREG